ncbi:tRNA (adenosine(37)-N6)-threonylcarbamoyltransferase complex dimerization subunit type 1 TsaB [Plastoroseomonas hellenica]|uniref:tRNA (adenosine(37)-N6)-threonylcarbamoyltransferase complex dimerization subunit type 1 TsaB n=1 Tax=Plastoroseomonas hellenica TaxID=2687306 RepID=UPI001BA68F1F|nr:tRNA (adenosine(37)-N6)-threonylcarbamoyltransferase complex dimerization subunit type 1 TsaB [Plastoroseomonas hellenica]MBR0644079.1 tRNA (adenosine(37)-N6)-threonylcarbamoyltransferase complex dimerization subunit type 1 TsaB [Plastoroseomonas hellenica]
MIILALDGALARCSAAVLADGAVLAEAREDAARGQAALLPPMVDAVLARAGVAAPALSAVAVGVGPGGFTGLRAALALAEGIALGAGLPLIGVTTGEALAAAIPAERRLGRALWSVVDNRRGRVVLERFAPGAMVPDGPPEAFEEAALPAPPGPVVIAGDAAAAVAARLAAQERDVLLSDARLPEAAALARVAAARLAGALPPRDAVPLYVEPPAVRAPAP